MHNEEPLLFSFTVFPLGAGDDVSVPVSRAVEIIAESGLDYQVTGASTLVEGAWDEVMPLLERCYHELTHEHERVYADISVEFHAGASGRLAGSVDTVEDVLEREVKRTP